MVDKGFSPDQDFIRAVQLAIWNADKKKLPKDDIIEGLMFSLNAFITTWFKGDELKLLRKRLSEDILNRI